MGESAEAAEALMALAGAADVNGRARSTSSSSSSTSSSSISSHGSGSSGDDQRSPVLMEHSYCLPWAPKDGTDASFLPTGKFKGFDTVQLFFLSLCAVFNVFFTDCMHVLNYSIGLLCSLQLRDSHNNVFLFSQMRHREKDSKLRVIQIMTTPVCRPHPRVTQPKPLKRPISLLPPSPVARRTENFKSRKKHSTRKRQFLRCPPSHHGQPSRNAIRWKSTMSSIHFSCEVRMLTI